MVAADEEEDEEEDGEEDEEEDDEEDEELAALSCTSLLCEPEGQNRRRPKQGKGDSGRAEPESRRPCPRRMQSGSH